MMRSMYSGVSGLRAHQVKMDVIGNNIANVNTVGYKASKVHFTEVFSQTVKGAGAPTSGRGGTNPQQIGLGINVGSIDVYHTKGSTQRTDNITDLMVDGNGFFCVTNDANAQNKFYTRAGNFTVDRLGYLVTSNGYKVLDKDMKPVQINKSTTKGATTTDTLVIKGNLNFTDEEYSSTVDAYDSLGDVHTLKFNFTGAPNEIVKVQADIDKNDPRAEFDGSGTLVKYNGSSTLPGDVKYTYRKLEVSKDDTNVMKDASGAPITEVYVKFNQYGEPVGMFSDNDGTDTVVNGTIDFEVEGTENVTIGLNRNMLYENGDPDKNFVFTQYSQESDVKATAYNGNSAGSIDTFSISSNGEVVGIFTNGERETLATIGLANFDNPAGLMKMGANMFVDTPNSGQPNYGQPSTGSFGSLTPGALEMSNVDLSNEFVDMITTQRGFQANSRIITTSDEILQELVNLKR